MTDRTSGMKNHYIYATEIQSANRQGNFKEIYESSHNNPSFAKIIGHKTVKRPGLSGTCFFETCVNEQKADAAGYASIAQHLVV